ncbi:MAG TPA: branched-chain amino acid ABC transporter permease, partial [Acetobacteraceae bacterium]|nr:branched-chain amino acid ABC transporter permease [Acetobacteraceae bacterium]
LYLFVHHTRFGTAIRAAAIDQDAARLMGINVNRVIASVFVIGPALGASVLIENGMMLIWGANVHVFPSGLLPDTSWNVVGATITFVQVMIIIVSIVLMAALYVFVHHTRFGTAIRAAAIDQDTARLMGINVNRVIASVFVIGPALGAIGGLFVGIYYREAYFTMGWTYGLYAFIAAILGGIGNIPGAMLGGVLLGLFNAFAAGYVSSSWQDAITFGLLIAILLVRPTGILGERVAEKV